MLYIYRLVAVIVFVVSAAYELEETIDEFLFGHTFIVVIGLMFTWMSASIMQHDKTIFSKLKFTLFGKVEFFPIFIAFVSYFLFINLQGFAQLGFALDGYTAEAYADAAFGVITGIVSSVIVTMVFESLIVSEKQIPVLNAVVTSVIVIILLGAMGSTM